MLLSPTVRCILNGSVASSPDTYISFLRKFLSPATLPTYERFIRLFLSPACPLVEGRQGRLDDFMPLFTPEAIVEYSHTGTYCPRFPLRRTAKGGYAVRFGGGELSAGSHGILPAESAYCHAGIP